MKVTFDRDKRQRTLKERGLDFEDAPQVLSGFHLTQPDVRKDYGEDRETTIGLLGSIVVVLVWTERKGSLRVISMRKADRDERERYFKEVDRPG